MPPSARGNCSSGTYEEEAAAIHDQWMMEMLEESPAFSPDSEEDRQAFEDAYDEVQAGTDIQSENPWMEGVSWFEDGNVFSVPTEDGEVTGEPSTPDFSWVGDTINDAASGAIPDWVDWFKWVALLAVLLYLAKPGLEIGAALAE